MNTRYNTTTTATIQLNETFIRLGSGAANIGDIMTERASARAALLANEDAYARRGREWVERMDPFATAYCH